MIIAIPQLNYKAGDIQGNSEKIISAIQKAQNQKADLLSFSKVKITSPFCNFWKIKNAFWL